MPGSCENRLSVAIQLIDGTFTDSEQLTNERLGIVHFAGIGFFVDVYGFRTSDHELLAPVFGGWVETELMHNAALVGTRISDCEAEFFADFVEHISNDSNLVSEPGEDIQLLVTWCRCGRRSISGWHRARVCLRVSQRAT